MAKMSIYIKKNKAIVAIIFFITVIVLVFGPFTNNLCKPQIPYLYFNRTASIPIGIYLEVPKIKMRCGDIVVYKPTEVAKELAFDRGWLEDKNEFLVKKIGALPGDHFSINNSGEFSIKGKYIGQQSLYDTADRPLPRLRGQYVVPDKEFLPYTDNPKSFDGRYTGTVPIENIKARVIPLLTFERN